MFGQGFIHRIRENHIRLTRLQAHFENFLPKLTRGNFFNNLAGMRALKGEVFAVLNRFHKVICDVQAVMQVKGLTIKVARGLTNFKELFDFWVMDVEIDSCRAAAQRPL